MSDSGYANNFHNIEKSWPLIPKTKIIKQATYTSPDSGNTVWPQFLINKSEANNILTPKENIGKSVKPILSGNNYSAGGATTVCKGLGKKGEYTPPPIGPLRSGESCLKSEQDLQSYNQIDSYLKQHNNRANPSTVYIIWGGANNAFIELGKFGDKSIFSKLYFMAKYLITNQVQRADAIQAMKNAAKDIAYDT